MPLTIRSIVSFRRQHHARILWVLSAFVCSTGPDCLAFVVLMFLDGVAVPVLRSVHIYLCIINRIIALPENSNPLSRGTYLSRFYGTRSRGPE